MAPGPPPLTPDEAALERQQRDKYRRWYRPAHMDHAKAPATDYFSRLVALRLRLVRGAYRGGVVLDLCCGSGDYLVPVAPHVERIVGMDFSPELIAVARERAHVLGLHHATFALGNARALPLRAGSVTLVFSFAALYYIPRVEQVLDECARVLAPAGTVVLDFGIRHSLNTIVCRHHPELAAPCHVPLGAVHRALRAAGLDVVEDRAFQVLPLWGDRPRWLRPLLHPRWKALLARPVGGRMLDEWVSGAWPFRRFAFRHIIVACKRA